MPQIIADARDIAFNLYEIFDAEQLCTHEPFKNFSRSAFDLILAEARDFAVQEMLATYHDGDRKGVCFAHGQVRVPQSFHKVHQRYCENQWSAPASSRAYGGQGLPFLITAAIREYMMGGNWPIYAYGSMGVGAGQMIERFGTPEQKRTYVKNLYTGHWGGTMLQTEPQAGTDVGALGTTAVLNEDGSYLLTGSKIYITNGDHDLCENIIHPVLARIEGDPPGTSGLSVFIVPKFCIQPDGGPGTPNDIVCTGVEQKLGLNGSATCSMVLGSRGRCRGELLGRPGQGMKIIFTMMNQGRLNVGLQALSYGSSAYLYALNHARNRIQGRAIHGSGPPAVPIIRHPDIKRNLMEMKAYTEGMRSLIYYTMNCLDRSQVVSDPDLQEHLKGLVELITPVIKGYCCERAYGVCVRAMQVYGGAGYLRDYPVESILRDCKITTIYEGCTGIQAMDLVNRKLYREQGRFLEILIREIGNLIEKTEKQKAISALGRQLKNLLERLAVTWSEMEKQLRSRACHSVFARATPFLEVMGDICMAWMLLLRASTALAALAHKLVREQETAFYQGQVRTARFFYYAVLPVTAGKLDALSRKTIVVDEVVDTEFGGMG